MSTNKMPTMASGHSSRRVECAKTAANWHAMKERLLTNDAGVWVEAFSDYFYERLRPRYLEPIKFLQESGKFEGEGFSIVVIQCSLIEFLESTMLGTKYRHRGRGAPPLALYEYSSSEDAFVTFLTGRKPFSNTFTKKSAHDFYSDVRCGLLHEAQTKNGWRILANGPAGVVADVAGKIVYRNNFQAALLQFIEAYGIDLQNTPNFQQAFIRKFDDLFA